MVAVVAEAVPGRQAVAMAVAAGVAWITGTRTCWQGDVKQVFRIGVGTDKIRKVSLVCCGCGVRGILSNGNGEGMRQPEDDAQETGMDVIWVCVPAGAASTLTDAPPVDGQAQSGIAGDAVMSEFIGRQTDLGVHATGVAIGVATGVLTCVEMTCAGRTGVWKP